MHIGNNIIIGANSLVNKDCLEEGVYAGNSVRYIMSLSDYRKKRQSKQLDEAYELVIEYKKRYGKIPDKKLLREFFWLFEKRNEKLCQEFIDVHKLSQNYEISTKEFINTNPKFNGYQEFIKYVEDRYENEKN